MSESRGPGFNLHAIDQNEKWGYFFGLRSGPDPLTVIADGFKSYEEAARASDAVAEGKMLIHCWPDEFSRVTLALDPEDIAEAIVRCGWTALNDAVNVTQAHAREIRICEELGAQTDIRPAAEAREWWKGRRVA